MELNTKESTKTGRKMEKENSSSLISQYMKENSEKMSAALKGKNSPLLLLTEDSRISSAELRTNKLVFLHTDMTHNDVVAKRKTFCEFLKTSCLGD